MPPTSRGAMRAPLVVVALILPACGVASARAVAQSPPPAATTGRVAGPPAAWRVFGAGGAFTLTVDPRGGPSGGAAVVVGAPPRASDGTAFYGVAQVVRADDFRGKRARLSARVRVQDVGPRGARLYMRVDGRDSVTAFDSMEARPLTGTSEGRDVSSVRDVDPAAVGIEVGAFLAAGGEARWADFRLETVGADVPTTAPATRAAPRSAAMSALLVQELAWAPRAVENAALAAELPLDARSVEWLRTTAVPFVRTAPGGSSDDLAPIARMLDGARLVALGEGTHGTHEFFQMKHRLLAHLVQTGGVTAFAIEANWPEANEIDRYVRTGDGDPAALLANLRFWTWNTQEILTMILWMRAYNARVPAERQVRFFGFDMQLPVGAADTVVAFVRRADPARLPDVQRAYACVATYRAGSSLGAASAYDRQPPEARAACRAAVDSVHAALVADSARYAERQAREAVARAVQSARLVTQWEEMAGAPSFAARNRVRDRAMADNVDWLLAQLPPGARMVLWAHNGHVRASEGAMGAYLRERHAAAYGAVGFTFGRGELRAVPAGPAAGRPTVVATDYVMPGSFEDYARAVGWPRFAVDLRALADSAGALGGAVPVRLIGAVYDPLHPELYFLRADLRRHYDVLIHVALTSASIPAPIRRR